MAAAIAVTSAQAQSPPIKIDCTFHRLDFTKEMLIWGSPRRKWLLQTWHGYYPEVTLSISTIRTANPRILRSPGIGFRGRAGVVLGTGRGQLTANTDLPKLCIQLAKVASDHGANAINYQIFKHGTELHVQFLRIRDDILQKVRRQNPAQ